MKQLRVDIDNDLHLNLVSKIPWGYSCRVVRKLLQMCLNETELHGPNAIMDLLANKYQLVRKEE